MNEGTKTGLFWAAAVILVGIATIVTWPRGGNEAELVSINKPLFEKFSDPLAAASMKIVTFDDKLGQLESFEVAKDRQSGLWSIPSRQGYPADAADQMEKAATALLGLKILDIKTDKAEEHADYGVIEPNMEKLSVGDAGVGRLVTIKDADNSVLASVIIGNPVKEIASHRYVRIPQQDPVYEVELDDSALTTQFSRWIEEDLLQLDTFDIAGVKVQKYSVAANPTLQGLSVEQRRSYDAELSLDDTNQWQLENLVVFDESQAPQVRVLEAEEALNTAKLNTLKTALDDLKIVDVVRKPEGMSADLKADKSLVTDNDSVRSLAGRGFYPVQGAGEGGVDILSANGEMVVDLKNGVEYVLRFGNISGIDEGDQADDAATEEGEEASKGGSNRYLLVTTRLNEAMIPAPEFKPVPQTVEELEAMLNPPAEPAVTPGEIQLNPAVEPPADQADEAAGDETAAEETPEPEPSAEETPATEEPAKTDEPATTEPPTTEEPPAEPAPAETPDEPAPGGENPAGDGEATSEGSGAVSGGGQDPEAPAQEPASGADAPAEQPPADEPPVDETPAVEPPAVEQPKSAAEEFAAMSDEEKQEYLQAEQEKLNKENQRLRDEWKEKLEEANKRVRELNARFADWYYIIPESTYSNLQIKLDELIQAKSAAAAQPPAGVPGAPNFPQFNFNN